VNAPPASAGSAFSPLRELTLARLRLFFREPGAVFWTFGFPLLLSVALGIAFRNRPAEPVRVGIFDGLAWSGVRTPVLSTLKAAPEIRVTNFYGPVHAREALRVGKIDLLILTDPTIQYVFDPMRPESRLARALADAALHPRGPPATVDKPVTEPGSRYIDFLVPGLVGMQLMSAGMWGIGYVVVEMRTKKLLKRLVATPMSRGQFLWSFVVMRAIFLLLELPVLLGFAYLVFGVGIAGSLPLLLGVSLLGALAFAGIGLLVASRAQNTQTVSGLINLVMLPMFVGSGVFFSTARFPESVQPFLRVLPLTALNDALRAVMIDGAGLGAVAGPVALLAGTAAVTFLAALRVFRWK
jgi:ABC-2 type transport system permease protein